MSRIKKYNITKSKLFSFTIVLWTIFSFLTWIFYNHQSFAVLLTQKENILISLLVLLHYTMPLLLTALILLIFAFYAKFLKRHQKRLPVISVFYIFIFFIGFTIILYIMSAYIRWALPSTMPAFSGQFFVLQMSHFLETLALQVLWMAGFSLSLYLLGRFLYKKVIYKYFLVNQQVVRIFLYFGFGIIAWVYILFFLGLLSILNIFTISFIVIVLLFLQYKHVKFLLIKSFKKLFYVNPLSLPFFLSILIILTLSISLIDSLHTNPQFFDESTTYLAKAQSLAQTHTLVPGGYPFPFELLAATGYIFFGHAMPAFANNIIFTLLGMSMFFYITYSLTKNRIVSLIISIALLTLPLSLEFISRENKVEPLLFFIAALTVFLLLSLIKNPNKPTLFTLAVFLGFAVSIKLTAIFLILAIFPSLFFILYEKHKNFKSVVLNLLLFLMILLLPLLPWGYYALYTNYPISEISIQSFLVSTNRSSYTLQIENLPNQISFCENTSVEEDLGRFKPKNYSHIFSPIILPWHFLTIRQLDLRDSAIGVGYVFFIFYGIFYLFLLRIIYSKSIPSQRNVHLIFITVLYWILWIFFAKNIIWYGYPGFILYALLVSVILHFFSKNNKKLYIFLLVIIMFNIIAHIAMRTFYFSPIYVLGYTASHSDPYLGQSIIKIVNKKENINKKILFLPRSELEYYVKNSSNRIIDDWLLQYFSCLSTLQPNAIKKDLARYNISYIVTDLDNVDYLGKTTNNSYAEKANTVSSFLYKNLPLIKKEGKYRLFIVPNN